MEKIDSTSKILIPKRSNTKVASHSVVYGEYTAGGTVCTESAINNVVARVHLDSRSFNEYLGNKAKKGEPVSKVTKGIKRKLQESSPSDKGSTNNVEVQVKKRGRGRPRKIQENVVSDKKDVDLKTDVPVIKKKEYLENKSKEAEPVSDAKKGIKRKLQECSTSDKDSTDNVEVHVEKRGRGRPRKIQRNVVLDKKDVDLNTDILIVKKRGRGRPKKNIDKTEETGNASFKSKLKSNFESLKIKRNLFKIRLNGDKNTDIVTTTRVRKPNSKFQDFVVSPNIRNFAPSSPDPDYIPKEKEKPLPVKVKSKPKPEEITNTVAEDPLALSNGDDIVHSFLPVFDESPRFDNVLILKNKSSKATEQLPNVAIKMFKEKENQVNNVQPKIQKDTPKLDLQESDKEDYSPPKLRNRSNSALSTPQLPVVKLPKIKIVDKDDKQQSRKSMAVNSDSVTPQKKPVVRDGENGVEKPAAVKQTDVVKVNTLKGKTKVNGSNRPIKQKRIARYVLIECNSSPHRTKVPKFSDVDFNKLVRSLKSVKLPAANWKIRIVVSRQQTITEVTFTNKEVNERCVKFSRICTGYVITFGKSVVKLLGAPSKISSFNDVTVLLDIIHNVSSNDPVLEYSTENNV